MSDKYLFVVLLLIHFKGKHLLGLLGLFVYSDHQKERHSVGEWVVPPSKTRVLLTRRRENESVQAKAGHVQLYPITNFQSMKRQNIWSNFSGASFKSLRGSRWVECTQSSELCDSKV